MTHNILKTVQVVNNIVMNYFEGPVTFLLVRQATDLEANGSRPFDTMAIVRKWC